MSLFQEIVSMMLRNRPFSGLIHIGLITMPLAWMGCFIVVDEDHRDHRDPPQPPDVIIHETTIDEGKELTANPGEGVGIFVEHRGSGLWHVWTTCDTEKSGYSCAFELGLSGYGLTSVEPEDLEGADSIHIETDFAHLTLETSVDTDGVTLTLDELAPLTVEALLDGASAAEFVTWVAGGQAVQGAPSNPVAFVP